MPSTVSELAKIPAAVSFCFCAIETIFPTASARSAGVSPAVSSKYRVGTATKESLEARTSPPVLGTGNKSEFVVYADSGHGFHADFRADNYRKQDAEDGWKRMLAWFKLWGVA